MEKLTLIVNNIPPSLNVIERMHHIKRNKMKSEWEWIVGWEAKIQKIIPSSPYKKCKVRLIYHFRDDRGRDPDNYNGKWTIDGMKKIGILANDTFDNVDLKAEKGSVDRKNPHMEITIERMDE